MSQGNIPLLPLVPRAPGSLDRATIDEQHSTHSPEHSPRYSRSHSKKYTSGSRAHTCTIEESLCFDDLLQLKAGMDEFHTAGKELTEKDFLKVVKARLNLEGRTDEDVAGWFRRIDANANDSVQWDEVGNYLLSEGQQRSLTDHKSFEYGMTAQPRHVKARGAHCEAMTQIIVNQRFSKVITTGRDGKIKIWNGDTLAFEKVMYNGTKWIVDAKIIHGGHRMLTCLVDRKLCLFDCKVGEMVRCYAGSKGVTGHSNDGDGMPSTDTIDARGSRSNQKFGVAVDMGTTSTFNVKNALIEQGMTFEGFQKIMEEQRDLVTHRAVEVVRINDFAESPQCLDVFERGYDDLVFMGLRDGMLLGYKMSGQAFNLERIYKSVLHEDAVSQCRYSKAQLGVFTTSWDKTIKLTNIEIGKQRVYGTEIGHQKAIFTMDWSESMKLLVTGGTEREIFVWHPVMEKKPLFKLEGHQAPLVSITIVESQNQIVSLSSDRVIKIWDTRIFKAITTIQDVVTQPNDQFSQVVFDEQRSRIITGGTLPIYFTNKPANATFPLHYCGHSNPPVGVLFSPDFDQVITADNEIVNVWNVHTGERVFTFTVPMQNEARMVACALDSNKRRLVTVTNAGDVGMWNCFNGQSLNAYENKGLDVSGMAHMQRVSKDIGNTGKKCVSKCLFTATSGFIHIYPDTEQFEVAARHSINMPSHMTLKSGGIGDVSAITPVTDTLVAVGTERGFVFFVNVLTASVETGYVPERLAKELGGGSRVQGLFRVHTKGDLMLVAKNDGMVEMWNLHLKEALGSVCVASETLLENPCMFPNDSMFLFSDAIGNVHCYSLGGLPMTGHAMHETIVPSMVAHSHTFRAHNSGITSIMACVPRYQKKVFIVTSGVDSYVRIFSTEGACVGAFGDRHWLLRDAESWQCLESAQLQETATVAAKRRVSVLMTESFHEKKEPNNCPSEDSPPPPARLVMHSPVVVRPTTFAQLQHSSSPVVARPTPPQKPNTAPMPRPCAERRNTGERRVGLLKQQGLITLLAPDRGFDFPGAVPGPIAVPVPPSTAPGPRPPVVPKPPVSQLENCYNFMRESMKGRAFFESFQSEAENAPIKSRIVIQKKETGLPHWTDRVSSKIDLAKMQDVVFKRFEIHPTRGRGGNLGRDPVRKRSIQGGNH